MSAEIARKLLAKPGTRVWSSDAGLLERFGVLGGGALAVDSLDAAEVAIIFAPGAEPLRATLAAEEPHLKTPVVLWVAYPKANRADINRDTLWPILRGYGMRPVSQVALDEEWSALRFRALRPGETFDAG